MVWSHPDISLEDVLQLIKGFVDILILASGYQSSGEAASWNSESIKKAVQWGIFFEEVFRRLQASNNCFDSIKELDAAIRQMASDSHFPKGLAHLSSETLANGKSFVLKHFFQNIQLRETHINALLISIIEMDLESMTGPSHLGMDFYLENLTRETKMLNLAPKKLNFMKSCINPGQRDHHILDEGLDFSVVGNIESLDAEHDCLSTFIIKEILERQSAASCLSSANRSLNSLRDIVVNNIIDNKSNIEALSCYPTSPKKKGTTNVRFYWKQWRSRSLSYLLDARTMRLLSGVELIFSASRDQWIHILNPLRHETDIHNKNLLEIIELVLLALISRQRKTLIECLISHSSEHLVPNQHCDAHDLLLRIHLNPPYLSSKENNMLEYLMDLLGSETRLLWRLPPILVAASVSLSSILSKLYLSDLERQLMGGSSFTRHDNCKDDGRDRIACETSERIWSLYLISCHSSHQAVYS